MHHFQSFAYLEVYSPVCLEVSLTKTSAQREHCNQLQTAKSFQAQNYFPPLPSPAKRHEMKCCHTCFHRDGINTSLIGPWRHLKACVPVVLRLRCPKEQGLVAWGTGGVGHLLRSRRQGGMAVGAWVGGWSLLQGKKRRAAEGRCSVCSGHRMSLKCRNALLVGVHLEYF